MDFLRRRSIIIVPLLLIAASTIACVTSFNSDANSRTDDESYPTWQYKLTVDTEFGMSDIFQENATVVFDGTFVLDRDSRVILSDEGKVTVTGSFRCREANSDPPRMLEGTLEGEQSFTVDGILIRPEDYDLYDIFPTEPLTEDVAPLEYALISLPQVVDRDRVAVSFGREKCTNTMATPIIAETVSFGQIPYFQMEQPTFIVHLDPQIPYNETIALDSAGSKVLSKAVICIAPPGKCP